MKLIVGLGNPEPEYEKTRHNVGFLFLDKLCESRNAKFENDKYMKALVSRDDNFIFAKPLTSMNRSGESVKELVKKFNINLADLCVVHDDLDLKIGEYKVQLAVGPKLHNGITSIEEELNSKEFLRIRVGVDNRDPVNRIPGEAYVLQNFTKEEIETLDSVFQKIINEENFSAT